MYIDVFKKYPYYCTYYCTVIIRDDNQIDENLVTFAF